MLFLALLRLLVLLGQCQATSLGTTRDTPNGLAVEDLEEATGIPGLAVRPFDEHRLIPSQEHAEKIEPLGSIRLVRGLFSHPKYFPILFSVYTRRASVTGLSMSPRDYRVRLGNLTQVERHLFDLAQLVPPRMPFDPSKRTIILVPGYMSSNNVHWTQRARDQWLQLEDVNVIIICWSEGNKKLYSTAVANVKIVARQITMFLYYLAELNGLDFESRRFRESVQLVGHSLGAHISGFVGQELRGQVGRVTALDPAGPIFDKQKPNDRVDPTDAVLVDVVHTNAGRMRYMKAGFGLMKAITEKLVSSLKKRNENDNSLLAGSVFDSFQSANSDTAWFGLNKDCGHLDYYANGGSVQPGCADPLHICDHRRASQIYVQALAFEVEARKAYGADSPVIRQGLHRLTAFPAADYGRFRSGASVMRNCPMLVKESRLLDARARLLLYRRCTVPIDFVKAGPQFRDELEQEYGMSFRELELAGANELRDDGAPASFEADDRERQLHFETLSKEPLVSEHHLMLIHLNRAKPPAWKSGCRLALKIESHLDSELYAAVEFEPKEMEPISYNDFFGLCFLFPSTVDWRMAYPAPAQDTLINPSSPEQFIRNQTEAECNARNSYQPGSISLVLSYNKGTIISKMRDILKPDSNNDCDLNVKYVETMALTGIANNISSWHENQASTNLLLHQVMPWTHSHTYKSPPKQAIKLDSSRINSKFKSNNNKLR